MIQKMYSVRDQKAEVFNLPFYSKTHGEAERNFTQLVNDEKSMPGNYPDDYDLYWIGDYNDQTGVVTPLDTPQHIIKAVQVSKKHKASLN